MKNADISYDPPLGTVADCLPKECRWVCRESAAHSFEVTEINLAHVVVGGRRGMLKLRVEFESVGGL